MSVGAAASLKMVPSKRMLVNSFDMAKPNVTACEGGEAHGWPCIFGDVHGHPAHQDLPMKSAVVAACDGGSSGDAVRGR